MTESGYILKGYDGVVGRAFLEYRTCIKVPCAQKDPFGLCNVMECLYCNNCYYKITLENGEFITNTNVDLNTLNDDGRGIKDYNHVILFYDYIPNIDDLFWYLFDENSQFRIVRTKDSVITNDYVRQLKK